MFEVTEFTASWLIPLLWYVGAYLLACLFTNQGNGDGTVILGWLIFGALFWIVPIHFIYWMFRHWNEWHIFIIK